MSYASIHFNTSTVGGIGVGLRHGILARTSRYSAEDCFDIGIRHNRRDFRLPVCCVGRSSLVVGLSGTPPRGTLEDNRAWVCFGSSGRPFGMVVLVRTDAALHAVLLPGFSHPDSVELYLDFLRNDK